jgi:hypothetical protein
MLRMWNTITSDIEQLPKHDSMLLQALEDMFVSGFSSRRRAIVNTTVELWNKTFGQQSTLALPSSLVTSLERLSSTLEISLPTNSKITFEEVRITLIIWISGAKNFRLLSYHLLFGIPKAIQNKNLSPLPCLVLLNRRTTLPLLLMK